MARQIIDIGAVGNDGTGDSIRDSFNKVNQNFLELYSSLGLGTRLTFLGLSDSPASTYAGYENAVVTVNQTETGLKFKQIKGGTGVTVDTTTDSNQIILNAVFSQISADKNPHLGGNLSATYGGVQYRIQNLVDPVTTDEAARKGYVDTKISRAGVNAIDPATGLTNSAFGYMTGPLILSRSPVPDDDNTYGGLIAATKSYVDGAAFGSAANLYVATSGLDARPGVSDALQGRALAYAYRTVEAALKRAEELILQSRVEIGPYKKVLTYNSGVGTCTLSAITISSQSGSGFIGSAIMSIDTVTLSSVGTNYNVGDIVTLSGGTIAPGGQAATLKVLTTASTPGAIVTFAVLSSGSYTAVPGSSAVTSTASNATQTTYGAGATFNVTYKVSGVSIASGGSNYGLVSVRITGGGGSGAFGTAYILNGVIQSITITDKGTGFTSVPTVVANLPTFAIYTAGLGTDFSGIYSTNTPAAVATRHIRPGQYLRGETSGALAQILTHTGYVDPVSGNEFFDVDIKYGSFQLNEPISFGDTTKNTQVTVFIESGIYYENYPLKVPQNVAIVGDEFRRVIIKPASGTSTSPWAFQYFRRDLTVDSLTTATQLYGYQYLTDPTQPVYPLISNPGNYNSAAQLIYENKAWMQAEVVAWIGNQISNNISPFTSDFTFNTKTCQRDVGLIIDAIIFDLRYGGQNRTVSAALKYLAGTTTSGYSIPTIAITTQLQQTVAGIQRINALAQLVITNTAPSTLYQQALTQTIDQAYTAEVGASTVITNLVNATTNIISGSGSINYPKNNNQLDVFLCNDATMIRRVTAQGHGGFMMVLDPAGQILAKSPYCQESASFIGSTGRKQFAGGMFVDGFTGNLEFRMTAIDAAQTKLSITGLQRFPLLPASVIISGSVYRVNYVRDYVYNALGSTANFVLDPSNPYTQDVGPQNATITVGNPAVITKVNHGLQANATVTFNSVNTTIVGINLLTGTATATTATSNLITLNSTVGLTVGQSIVFAGTTMGGLSAGTYWITSISTGTTTATASTNSTATFANSTITGSSLTIAGTITGTIVPGMYLTGQGMAAGTYIVSGSGTTWTINQNSPVTNITITGTLNSITLASVSGLIVGDSVTFSGTSFGGISTVTTYYITFITGSNIVVGINVGGIPTTVISGSGSMTVTSTLNQITVSTTIGGGNVSLTTASGSMTWSSTFLTVGNTYGMSASLPITITGATSGGVTAGTYYVLNIPTSTTLVVSSTLNGNPITATSSTSPTMTITAGALPTGIVAGTRYYVQLANLGSNSFTITAIKGSTTSVVASGSTSGVYYDRIYELLMPGNRSMLSNDFTQVADLGYGVIVTNGGLTEAVSMFTYYCQISYYSINGGQIRSIAGSSAHGVYALVAEGSDPLEVPTPTDLYYPMQQAVTCYFPSSTYANTATGVIIYITNYTYVPLSNSELEIDHGSGILTRYPVNSAYTGTDLPVGVVRLTLGATTGATGLSGLYAVVPNGTVMTIRQNQTIMLSGNLSAVSVRPSTGLVLAESSNVYRVLQFTSYTDPNQPAVCLISNASPAVVTTFAVTTTATGTITQNTIIVASAANIAVNQYVTGTGIGTGAYVTSIVGTTVSLSVANSGTVNGSVTFAPGHGLLTNYTVTFSTSAGGSLPTGINTTTTYYVISTGLTATSFQFSTLKGGSAVSTSTAGSGTFLYTVQGLTTTLLRENYNYVNLTVYQPNDYVNYATTATATSATGNLVTVGSTTGMQIGMPIQFGGSTSVTATDAVTNYLTVGSSYNLTVGMPIQFTGTAIGGISLNTTYYVANIISGTQIQISSTLNGSVFNVNSYPSVVLTPSNAGAATNVIQILKSGNPQYTQVLSGFAVTTLNSQSIPVSSTVTAVGNDVNSLYWDITLNQTVIIPSTGSMTFVAPTAYTMTLATYGAFGGLTAGQQYYIASIPDSTHLSVTLYQQEATTATATTATSNLITVGNTIGMISGQPIVFNGVSFTATATASSTNLITISSTVGLTVNQQINFTAVTQTPTLLAATTGTNLLTLSSVTGLTVGEPIVFTAVTQTGSVTATSSTNTGTVTLSGSTAGMVVGQSIVFSQITQTTTATTVTSAGVLTVGAGGTTGMSVGETVNFTGTPFGGLSTSTTYYIIAVNSGANQISLSLTYGGSALAIAGGSGSLTVTAGSSYGGLASATTYYIKQILTSNTITITSSYSADVLGSVLALTSGSGSWTYIAGGIFGGLVSGNTYYITSVNSGASTVTVAASYGGSNYSLTSGNGAWTSVAGNAMGGVTSGSSYYITQVNTVGNTIQISNSYGGDAITLSSSNGAWTSVAGSTLGGISTSTNYYIKTLDSINNQITISTSQGGAVVGLSSATGSWTGLAQNSFGGITQGQTYYILSVPDTTHISITASSGSSTPVTLTTATGVLNVAASTTTQTLTNATGTIAVLAGGGVPVTITIATSTLFTTTNAHGLNVGDVIKLQTTGALPTGLTIVTHYFVVSTPTTTTFTVSLTPGGVSVATSGTQSGTQYFGKVKGRAGDTSFAVVPISTTDRTRVVGAVLNWKGVDYIITRYDPETVTNTAFARVYVNQINLTTGVVSSLGLNDSVLPYIGSVTLKAGVRRGTSNATGTLTIRIALTRVTGHDLLEIGTGSYADTNYPHEIYGPAVNALGGTGAETIERTVGRVFYVTTDQYGNFRVGPYFNVDQGTGKVSFSAAIALSNLDGLGFKRGVPVAEFSTDSSMANNAIDTVPVQNAIRTFVDRRLGMNYSGSTVDPTQLIPAGTGGFMALSGILPMKGNMSLGSNRITNLANPVAATDAVNLQSLTLANITGFTFTSPTAASLATFTGTGNNVVNAAVGGDVTFALSGNTLTTSISAGAVTNAKIASGAAIDQAKLNLTAAPSINTAPGSYSQSQSGLASFDGTQFTVNYGWASIKDNGLPLTKLAQIGATTVLGNSTITTGNVGQISFGTIVDSGGAVKKGQYTSSGFLRRTGGTGTSDGDYTVIDSTAGWTGSADNGKLVIRDTSGNISVNAITVNQLNLNTSGSNAGVKAMAQSTTTTGGYTQVYAYLGNGGILLSDGSQASDKKNLYWNNAHYFKTIDGGSDAPIQASQIQVGTITSGGTTSPGTITGYWSLSSGSRLQATYSADLAEYYEGDKEYDVGTVLVFGGEFDVTLTNIQGDTRVAGVVSNNAGYVMYDACPGLKNLIALAGRVPCKVVGKVKKGDILITSKIPGVAVSATGDVKVGTVVGKALKDYDSDHIGLIEIAVGRA